MHQLVQEEKYVCIQFDKVQGESVLKISSCIKAIHIISNLSMTIEKYHIAVAEFY